ncbi:MAG TPA: carbohydrate kinase [Parapedobacter sp.]|uniref:carbohydrate kinase family protein n=1 Tax=Parapedobacter sp. TaxID=1958893 RepID=UPI002BBDC0D0|nr:carbohydrate kinase [Parapedobacter sp.]HWK58606.1 carbohydrate kinase [Parapedobacter sp.]
MIRNNVICFGETLWDNLINGRRVGGAPLNVCYHLSKNGIKSQIVSQVGKDAEGEDLLQAIHSLGVDTTFLKKTSDYPTSQVVVNLLPDGRIAYEILENVAWDYILFDLDVAAAIEGADALVYGSLAVRNAVSRDTLFAYLPFSKCAIFDVNLRQPFFNKALILELMEHCHVLKINDEELRYIVDWLGLGHQAEELALANLLQVYPKISEIILTRGANGAVYCSRQQAISSEGLSVNVVDTVGCGDSFLAAFMANKLAGKPINHCLRQAILLSAFVATQEGGCPVYHAGLIAEKQQIN